MDAEDLETPQTSKARKIAVAAVIVVLVLGAIGALTTAIGIGPFGYRLFAYGEVKLFVYNGTPHFAMLVVDGSEYEVKPFEGQMIEVTGGDIEIDTTLKLVEINPETDKHEITDKLEHLETKSFHGDGNNWLYHVATEESTCLAVMDMSAYYNSDAGGEPKLIRPIFKDDRLQEFEYEDVLYPRGFLPDKANPPVIWLGAINCGVLEEPEKATVALQIKAEEARQLLERRRAQQTVK